MSCGVALKAPPGGGRHCVASPPWLGTPGDIGVLERNPVERPALDIATVVELSQLVKDIVAIDEYQKVDSRHI